VIYNTSLPSQERHFILPQLVVNACGRIEHSHSILNKEEFITTVDESLLVPIYKKGDKTGCSNY
jgi:hypothetical protein